MTTERLSVESKPERADDKYTYVRTEAIYKLSDVKNVGKCFCAKCGKPAPLPTPDELAEILVQDERNGGRDFWMYAFEDYDPEGWVEIQWPGTKRHCAYCPECALDLSRGAVKYDADGDPIGAHGDDV